MLLLLLVPSLGVTDLWGLRLLDNTARKRMLTLSMVLTLIQQHRLRIIVFLLANNIRFGISEVGALINIEFVYLDLMILITLMLGNRDVAHGLAYGLLL